MSYEINIIAINQKKPIHLDYGKKLLLYNEKENPGFGRYAEIWPFFSSVKGIKYSIVSPDEEGNTFYSYYVCHPDFEKMPISKECLPEWIPEVAKEDLTTFILKEEFEEDVISMIKEILESSPQKRILFQTSYQCYDVEVVFGVIKISKFVEMLKQKRVSFNTCYIVESDEYVNPHLEPNYDDEFISAHFYFTRDGK